MIPNYNKFSLDFQVEEFSIVFCPDNEITHSLIGDPEEMLRLTQNDSAPAIKAQLRDGDQHPIFLTALNPIKFLMRERFYFDEDIENEEVKVANTENVQIAPQNSERGVFQYFWQEGDLDTAGDYVATFKILLNGIENDISGPFELEDGDDLEVSIDGGNTQTFTFLEEDFLDITAATATEIVAIINGTITDGVASATDNGLKILIQTSNTSLEGSIKVLGGSAFDKLRFDGEFKPNTEITLPNPSLSVIVTRSLE